MFLIVSICYSFVLDVLLNYAVFWVCVQYIVYVSDVLLICVRHIQYLAQMSDLSNLMDILDDDLNTYVTDSTADVGYGVICVASAITLSGWVLFPDLLLIFVKLFIISNITSFFVLFFGQVILLGWLT